MSIDMLFLLVHWVFGNYIFVPRSYIQKYLSCYYIHNINQIHWNVVFMFCFSFCCCAPFHVGFGVDAVLTNFLSFQMQLSKCNDAGRCMGSLHWQQLEHVANSQIFSSLYCTQWCLLWAAPVNFSCYHAGACIKIASQEMAGLWTLVSKTIKPTYMRETPKISLQQHSTQQFHRSNDLSLIWNQKGAMFTERYPCTSGWLPAPITNLLMSYCCVTWLMLQVQICPQVWFQLFH